MKGFFPVQSTSLLYRIGLLVKEARLRMGLRQADLAERAGISLRAVRHIEGGKAEGVSLDDPALDLDALETNATKRVRLPRSNAEDF